MEGRREEGKLGREKWRMGRRKVRRFEREKEGKQVENMLKMSWKMKT